MGWNWRAIGDLLPGARAGRRLRRVEGLVDRIHHLGFGNNATFVGDNRVLVRVIAGMHAMILYVHADDKLISPWLIASGQHEPDLTEHFVRQLRPDSHCIDVGANIGYFTCLMGKYCPRGRVIGIEPNPSVHQLATDNLLLNALHEHAAVVRAAASDREGEVTLFRRVGRQGNTSIAQVGADFTHDMGEPPEEPFQVPGLRIDELRARMDGRVDFLKIDVEGAEPLAFAGARETIAGNPQLQIVVEWAPAQIHHAGFDVAAFVRDLAAMGLAPFTMTERRTQAISHDDLVTLPYQPGVLLRRAAA